MVCTPPLYGMNIPIIKGKVGRLAVALLTYISLAGVIVFLPSEYQKTGKLYFINIRDIAGLLLL